MVMMKGEEYDDDDDDDDDIYPWDNDEHAAGNVDGDQVVGELPLEYQLHF